MQKRSNSCAGPAAVAPLLICRSERKRIDRDEAYPNRYRQCILSFSDFLEVTAEALEVTFQPWN